MFRQHSQADRFRSHTCRQVTDRIEDAAVFVGIFVDDALIGIHQALDAQFDVLLLQFFDFFRQFVGIISFG
ncbi:hypothetical protein D3C74_471590 [compost metagenome]